MWIVVSQTIFAGGTKPTANRHQLATRHSASSTCAVHAQIVLGAKQQIGGRCGFGVYQIGVIDKVPLRQQHWAWISEVSSQCSQKTIMQDAGAETCRRKGFAPQSISQRNAVPLSPNE
jgi:hypothetical protein